MVIAKILFDKDEYNPGDQVKVYFTIDTIKICENIHKIVLFVGNGEKTQFFMPPDDTQY